MSIDDRGHPIAYPGAMWELLALGSDAVPVRLRIDGELQLGRDPHCDVRLLDEGCSRFHARLLLSGDQLVLEDLDSRNGSFVDDAPVRRQTLRDGQLLRLGSVAFLVSAGGAGSQTVSDQGARLSLAADRPTQARRPAPLATLLSRLSGLRASDRAPVVCRYVEKRLQAFGCALVIAQDRIAGSLDAALALRLATGEGARCLHLGQELQGHTVARCQVGSALSAALGPQRHLVVARSAEAEPFGAAELDELAELAAAVRDLLPALPPPAGAALVGSSPVMQRLRQRIARLTACDATVLIGGPSGSGKELIARALHEGSGRATGPFVAVNCAAIAESLFEAELFGVVKGAFTGADRDRPGRIRAAEGGCCFLDEIGELPAALQAKLLRVLQERSLEAVGGTRTEPINVRFIAATNRDLETEVAAGRFRADLFYRLDVLRISAPPLAQHLDDLPALAEHLISGIAERHGLVARPLSDAALALLRRQAWPGNVRQLANTLERALALAEGARIDSADLELDLSTAPPTAKHFPTLADCERAHIRAALDRAGGNKSRAARLLGIGRQTLYDKLAAYGLDG